ncbi:MAG: hypothetical protein CL726_03075 [Chloroflexi bacterium]|nr:hypothetical protein [Chloroflexota bacterium]
MSPTATAIATPASHVSLGSTEGFEVVGSVSPVSIASGLSETVASDGLNTAWAQIVHSVTNRAIASANSGSKIITIDLAQGESAQEFLTRLRMLLLFMNRDTDSISATISPSFRDDTYPAMLALVKSFQRSGASEDWRPDGPRSIRMGNARYLFVSVDMPVADRSPSPDTLIEIVAAHRISSSWYDQRVSPRVSSAGLTTVMFGAPNSPDPEYANSIFKRERSKNLSGRPGGIHFSRQLNWSATAAV